MLVLSVELCERLTYYTLAGSQSTYLKRELGYAPSAAASMNSVFSMLSFMWCLPGGLTADVFGRHRVIIASASLYALGAMLTAVSVHHAQQMALKGLFLFGGLVLIPVGTGGIKPNICNFGADQIGDETDAQRDTQKRFFTFFYMAVNVGVMVAFGFLVNITTQGLPSLGVPADEGYFAAYVVAAVSMTAAVCLFISGTKWYRVLPGSGIEGFATMVQSVVYSVSHGGGPRAIMCAVGWSCLPLFFAATIAASVWPGGGAGASGGGAETYPNGFERACSVQSNATGAAIRLLSQASDLVASGAFDDQGLTPASAARRLGGGGGGGAGVRAALNNLALALGSVACVLLVVAHSNNSWLKALPAKRATSFSVQEVRAGFATIPLLIVVNLAFNMGYNAMNNAFPAQACQMNTMLGGAQLNGAFFNFGDAIAIIAFTPVFEGLIYPMVGQLKGSPVRLGQKLVAGLFVAAASNAVALWLELQRRRAPLMCWEAFSECAPKGIHMRDMSAFWMFIPFALVGAAEILVNPSMYYFAYTAAPPKVRSLVQAFNLFFNGAVSNAFSAVAMEATFPNDLDTGHMEYYYFLNVTCALVGVVLYLYLTRCGSGAGDLEEDVEDELDITERRPTSRTAELERRRTGSSADFERRRTCSTAELERRPSHGPATPHQ